MARGKSMVIVTHTDTHTHTLCVFQSRSNKINHLYIICVKQTNNTIEVLFAMFVLLQHGHAKICWPPLITTTTSMTIMSMMSLIGIIPIEHQALPPCLLHPLDCLVSICFSNCLMVPTLFH